MAASDKELMTSDGHQSGWSFFCLAHIKRKRAIVIVSASLAIVLSLVAGFAVHAAFKDHSIEEKLPTASFDLNIKKVTEALRKKRSSSVNEDSKVRSNVDSDKNVIKRGADGGIDAFLRAQYREINVNAASEEGENFVQTKKRSSDIKAAAKKMKELDNEGSEEAGELDEMLQEAIKIYAEDLKKLEDDEEIRSLDNEIIEQIENAQMSANTIHKRKRNRREVDDFLIQFDPDTIKEYYPILEEKKREKRFVQQKLAEVRDEFIRCKKAVPEDNNEVCDRIYQNVMGRFRDVTQKIKEIEEIFQEIGEQSKAKSEETMRKSKKDKKKKKDRKSCESEESNEEEKKKKKKKKEEEKEKFSTTAEPSNDVDPPATTPADTATTEPPIETTSVDETTEMTELPPNSGPRMVPELREEFPEPEISSQQESVISASISNVAFKAEDQPSCPSNAFDSGFRMPPNFHESIAGSPQTFKSNDHGHNVGELIESKFERNQRGPMGDMLDDFFDDARKVVHKSKVLIEETVDGVNDLPALEETQSSQLQNADTNGQIVSLCEQIARQGKQANPQPQPQLIPVHMPLSNFGGQGGHFPPTGETTKVTSKVMMNPNFPMMSYPVCFVGYPQYAPQPQPMFYGGYMPNTGGKDNSTYDAIDPEFIRMPNSGGYFMPSASAGLRPIQVGNQFYVQNQQAYGRDASGGSPTYCTFFADSGFPTANSGYNQPEVVSTTEAFELPPGSERRSSNIPSPFDIIYATYPNQMFLTNHSIHRHCDADKLSCFSSNQCVSKTSWCDSKVDCLDASDETACSCKARLDESRVCDGFVDCPKGEDELGCFGCESFQFSCFTNQTEFEESGKGSSLLCYSSVEKCDGFLNCRNGRDESECSMIVKNLATMLAYSVSHSEGILYRNFKGQWFTVCANPDEWAAEACEMELGKPSGPPVISRKTVQIQGPFIQPNINQQNQIIESQPEFTDNCQIDKDLGDANQIMYVQCSRPKCGSSKLYEPSISFRSQRDIETRIVGGTSANPTEFPFIVAIFKDGHFHCGGSILNEDWIITACHCTRTFEYHYFEIRAGILRRSSYSPSAQISKVSHVIRHSEYEQSTMKNDIALMKLKTSLTFNRWVRPICLPSKEKMSTVEDWKFGPAAGTLCSTLGWGSIREKGPDPDDLKVVDVPIIAKCKHSYDQESRSICAGETFGTRDACQGDSGGPLVCKSSNDPHQWYLAGIVSHGEGCARANEPGVYTRVSLYINWINHNIDPKQELPAQTPRSECPGFVCVWGGSKCIGKSERCDGFVDCLGGEDEVDCAVSWIDMMLGATVNASAIEPTNVPEPTEIPRNKTIVKKSSVFEPFRCTRIHQMINVDQRCDRIFDCEDGTDEENCTCSDHLKTTFTKLICDGHVDCKDRTDELNCLSCNATQFACRHSKTCIDKSLQCNGEVDCQFKEDELECLALTDGNSVAIDVNGKPLMSSKGIITQNIKSSWRVLCDDNGDFNTKGLEIANDVCNVIGFKSASSASPIEMVQSEIETVVDPEHKIDIRKPPITKHQIAVDVKCTALEIECVAFQSHSFAVHPIQQEKLKKNSTHSAIRPDIIFVPVNESDHANLFVKPQLKVNNSTAVEPKNLFTIDWPWAAEIFMNGQFVAHGALVEKSWVLAESSCLGGSEEPLRTNHVTVLFGNTKSQFRVQSPYEQVSKVDCLNDVADSNVILLHLESPVTYNRHVLPALVPVGSDAELPSTCMVVALASDQTTKSMILRREDECQGDKKMKCYMAANVTEPFVCDNSTAHRLGVIVCKNKTNGWYPKAFHQMRKGFCDFKMPVSLLELNANAYDRIKRVIDHPCEKCKHHALSVKCETHRCLLGKCLQESEVCDLKNDCHDGSDERRELCQNRKSCWPQEFRCKNGKCIDKTKFCNHINDCGDKSDEPSECTCFSYLKSTDPSKLCDGIRHCWDRSDEDSTYCGSNCLSERTFKCGGSPPQCVPMDMVCDKRADCTNGADEEFCHGILKTDKDGFGEIMQRKFGVWHTKCFPKESPPSQDELEDLCVKLGFNGELNTVGRKIESNIQPIQESSKNGTEHRVEFQSFNATKVIAYSKFSPVKINDGFTVHIRPSKPLAKLVQWDLEDHENCHRMELKCTDINP